MATAKISQLEMNSRDSVDIWVSGGRGNLKTLATINIRVDEHGQVVVTTTGDNVKVVEDKYRVV